MPRPQWRVGGKIPLNVYEGERPMFQCHTPGEAARVVAILNSAGKLAEALERVRPWVIPYIDNGVAAGPLLDVDAALAQYTAGVDPAKEKENDTKTI